MSSSPSAVYGEMKTRHRSGVELRLAILRAQSEENVGHTKSSRWGDTSGLVTELPRWGGEIVDKEICVGQNPFDEIHLAKSIWQNPFGEIPLAKS